MTLMTHCPQSLLLIGGSFVDAKELVIKLLGASHQAKIEAGQHPDVHHYVPEGKGGQHPIANIRKIIEETALPPSEAPYKVFIIEEAEKMLPSSSNALLKTLEEPREDTYFFLLTDFPQQLLDTIRSRLYPVAFNNQSQSEGDDISAYVEMAKKNEWDQLLEKLPEEGLESFLQGLLRTAQTVEEFKKFLVLVEEGQKAKEHNVKERNIMLQCLISAVSPPNPV